MDNVLSHPAIQSAIVPFSVALVVILVLNKTQPKLVGLAAIAAFIATVGMVTGYSLSPMSSTKKIILLAYLAAAAGMLMDFFEARLSAYRNILHWIFVALSAIAILWVIWPVVSREGVEGFWGITVGLCAYVIWIVAGISVLNQKNEQKSAAVFSLALGTSVVSVIGATALYGQLAAPFAAATGAWLIVYMLGSQKISYATSFYYTASLVCAVLGAAATVYASLEWLTLCILALIPVVVHIPVRKESAVWLQIVKTYIAALVPVCAAIWYTAQQSADSGYYG